MILEYSVFLLATHIPESIIFNDYFRKTSKSTKRTNKNISSLTESIYTRDLSKWHDMLFLCVFSVINKLKY